jgi:hypothetical protein
MVKLFNLYKKNSEYIPFHTETKWYAFSYNYTSGNGILGLVVGNSAFIASSPRQNSEF